jgi:hypothetical protein
MLDSDVENVAKRTITQMRKAGGAAGYQWVKKKSIEEHLRNGRKDQQFQFIKKKVKKQY